MTDRRGGWGKPLSRRTFIKAAGGTGPGFVLYAYLPGGTKQALAQIPGGTLDPADVPKYLTPLLIPPVMPRAARSPCRGGKPADYYEISMRQFAQQILPAGLPGHHGVGLRRRQVARAARGCCSTTRRRSRSRPCTTGRCG